MGEEEAEVDKDMNIFYSKLPAPFNINQHHHHRQRRGINFNFTLKEGCDFRGGGNGGVHRTQDGRHWKDED